jgi:hypothetical protein
LLVLKTAPFASRIKSLGIVYTTRSIKQFLKTGRRGGAYAEASAVAGIAAVATRGFPWDMVHPHRFPDA